MKKQRLYDVSLTIEQGMVVYPGNAPVAVDEVKSIRAGESSNVSLLHIGTHASTHVDAPRHYLPEGAGADRISPDVLVGPVRLFQLPEVAHIERATLEALDFGGFTRVLFGTRNSRLLEHLHFHRDFAYLSGDAAQYLVEVGVVLVGVDYLSIEEFKKPGRPAHHALLQAGVVIVEGLLLSEVPAGDYELFCLPLKIRDADGAPARVFLRG